MPDMHDSLHLIPMAYVRIVVLFFLLLISIRSMGAHCMFALSV